MAKPKNTSSKRSGFTSSPPPDTNGMDLIRRSWVRKAGRFGRRRKHWLALGVAVLLSVGVIADRVNSLGEDAKGQAVTSAQAAPPKLAKEYIYSGSRLLAVEDAGSDTSIKDEGAVGMERLSESGRQDEAGTQQVSKVPATSNDTHTP